MPRRGTRRIAVDGEEYRWLSRRATGRLRLLVEAVAGGRLLVCDFEPHDLFRHDGNRWLRTRQRRLITGRVAAEIIRHARRKGWGAEGAKARPMRIPEWEADQIVPLEPEAVETDEVALEDLAIEQVSSLRGDISLDPEWRGRLFASEVGARLEIPTEHRGLTEESRMRGLRFCAWNDGGTGDGFVVFGIGSLDFPRVAMFTTNNPRIV